MNKFKKGMTATGIAVMIAAPFTAHHEGLRLKAYLDPVGIPTICFGETKGVKLGQEKTKEECHEMLVSRLGFFATAIDLMIEPPMHPKTHAALTSFAYNVGLGAFRNSTLLKKLNEGDFVGACKQLDRWVYAKGIKFKGLVERRKQERLLCLEGVKDDLIS